MWQAVQLRRSCWPRLLLLLWLASQCLLSWYWPADWPGYLDAIAVLLLVFSAYQVYQFLQVPLGTLWLHEDGHCRWQGELIQLLPQSAWCWAGFWLHWRDSQGVPQQVWWFADAFDDADKRRLARQLVQTLKQPHAESLPAAIL